MRWVIVALGVLFAAGVTAREGATPSDNYGLDLVHYTTVERSDGTYRRMLIERAALDAVRETGTIPDGTRILMETYYNPGELSTVFHKQKSGERWRYGSFNGLGEPNLRVGVGLSCLTCHTGAAETDLTFTKPSVIAVAKGAAPTVQTCDRGGRRPCALHLYRTD